MSERSQSKRTLVLCLGSRIRRDDGVGYRVAEALLENPPAGAEIRMSAVSGLHVIDEMEGFERVVVVDAVATGRRAPGTVSVFPLSAAGAAPEPSRHGSRLPSALEAAGARGAPVPSRVDLVAIEVAGKAASEQGLTPAVAAAVPLAAVRVREALASPLSPASVPIPRAVPTDGLAANRWFP